MIILGKNNFIIFFTYSFMLNYWGKENILNFLFIMTLIGIYSLYPVKGLFQQIISLLTFFILAPFLFKKIIFKKKGNIYNMGIGDKRQGLFWSLGGLILALLFLYPIFNYTQLLSDYGLLINLYGGNIWYFIWYKLITILFLCFVYQIFYIDFIISTFKDKLGWGAILLSWLFFMGAVFLSGSSSEAAWLYIIFMPLAGWIFYKSGSVWYPIFSNFLFIFIVDILFVKNII